LGRQSYCPWSAFGREVWVLIAQWVVLLQQLLKTIHQRLLPACCTHPAAAEKTIKITELHHVCL